ncbi:conserved hypothetical protein [Ricinus communis]|uniref:Uncharacterized protein n=1 Tax=Ricinus communis TaxID=3988 RepID=B9S160_RICCO|nr:conserved hypothetical protein [Ricinus communis]
MSKASKKGCANSFIGVRIQGLEAKMRALLQEVVNNDFKKDERETKKSFLEWLKDCVESDDDWETLKELKTRAVNHGIKLSHLLVDVIFLMSQNVKSLAKFEVLIASLEWEFQGENSVVICRIVDVLDTADRVTRKKKEAQYAWLKSIKGKAGMMTDEASFERRD